MVWKLLFGNQNTSTEQTASGVVQPWREGPWGRWSEHRWGQGTGCRTAYGSRGATPACTLTLETCLPALPPSARFLQPGFLQRRWEGRGRGSRKQTRSSLPWVFPRGYPAGRLADQSTVGTDLAGNLLRVGDGDRHDGYKLGLFWPVPQERGAQVQSHPTAFELRRSCSCLGAEGMWSLCAASQLLPECLVSLLTGSGEADSSFLSPRLRASSPWRSWVNGEPSLQRVGDLMSPAWRVSAVGKGQY